MTAANRAGPSTPPSFSKTPKKPKNSELLWAGTSVAKSERLRACEPPCTTAIRLAIARKSRVPWAR